MRSPALFNVLAGSSAAAGVNLLTAIQTSDGNPAEKLVLILCAIPWLGIALSLARAASLAEKARFEVALLRNPRFKKHEVESLERLEFRKIKASLRLCDTATLVLLTVGVAIILLSEKLRQLLQTFLA